MMRCWSEGDQVCGVRMMIIKMEEQLLNFPCV